MLAGVLHFEPCTLNQLFGCWYAWHLSLNGLTSESDGLIVNLRWQFHCIQSSTFHVCCNFGNFRTGCVTSVGVGPESVCDDVVYIRMESTLTTAYHTSLKSLRTISRTSVNVNMNPAPVSFFLPRENYVLFMAQMWRTTLRMCCSGLYKEGRNIKRR